MTDPTVKRAARMWLIIGYVVLGAAALTVLLVVASLVQAALAGS